MFFHTHSLRTVRMVVSHRLSVPSRTADEYTIVRLGMHVIVQNQISLKRLPQHEICFAKSTRRHSLKSIQIAETMCSHR